MASVDVTSNPPHNHHPEASISWLYTLIIGVGLLANLTVLALFLLRILKIRHFSIHILNIAIADTCALLTIVILPVESFLATDAAPLPLCVVLTSSSIVCFSVSTLTALSLAVERSKFAHLRKSVTITDRRRLLTCIAIWVVSVLYCLPLAIVLGERAHDYKFITGHSCLFIPPAKRNHDNRVLLVVFLVTVAAPILAICVFYWVLLRTVWCDQEARFMDKVVQKRLTLIVVAITVTYLVTHVLFIAVIIAQFTKQEGSLQELKSDSLYYALLYVQPAADPFLYAFLARDSHDRYIIHGTARRLNSVVRRTLTARISARMSNQSSTPPGAPVVNDTLEVAVSPLPQPNSSVA